MNSSKDEVKVQVKPLSGVPTGWSKRRHKPHNLYP